jgi:prepilin-type N-terminal cleavage/methylation domain-containing protein
MGIGKFSKHRGFTLLEMIVSLGIFTVVAVVAVGSLVRVTALNKQAQALQSAMNNLGSSMEEMSRYLRVGQYYYCGDTDPSGTVFDFGSPQSCAIGSPDNRFIAFQSPIKLNEGAGCQQTYAYWMKKDLSNPDPAKPRYTLQKGQRTSCSSETLTFLPFLDEKNLTIDAYQMGVYRPSTSSGYVLGDPNYALAFIRLKGHSGNRTKDQNFFDIQTSVSERIEE